MRSGALHCAKRNSQQASDRRVGIIPFWTITAAARPIAKRAVQHVLTTRRGSPIRSRLASTFEICRMRGVITNTTLPIFSGSPIFE